MSRSIHTTHKNARGLTKAELIEQSEDPNSDLNELAKKRSIKKDVKSNRKKLQNKKR